MAIAAVGIAGLSSCSSFFYQPSKNIYFVLDPARVYFEEVKINTPDGETLHGWYFPAQTQTPELKKGSLIPSKGLVVQFHGNGQNLTAHFLSFAWVMNEGYDFFTFDYRGYGESTGKSSQEGLYRDALTVLDWATKKSPRVIAVGQSLGGAVLARAFPDFKGRDSVKGIVLDSTFYSYQAIAEDVLSRFWLTWPFQWLGVLWVSDQTASEKYIPKISPTPLLVIHGTHDQTVPFKFGEKIFALAKEPKTLIKVEGGEHIDAMSEARHGIIYRKMFLDWVATK